MVNLLRSVACCSQSSHTVPRVPRLSVHLYRLVHCDHIIQWETLSSIWRSEKYPSIMYSIEHLVQQPLPSIGFQKVGYSLKSQCICQPWMFILVAGDGVFSMEENKWIVLTDLKTNTSRSLISLEDVKDVAKFILWSFTSYLLTLPFRKAEILLLGTTGNFPLTWSMFLFKQTRSRYAYVFECYYQKWPLHSNGDIPPLAITIFMIWIPRQPIPCCHPLTPSHFLCYLGTNWTIYHICCIQQPLCPSISISATSGFRPSINQ